MEVIDIQKAKPRHAADLADLYLNHTFKGANGPLLYDEEDFRRIIEAPHVRAVVAEAQGRAVGVALAFDMVIWGYIDLLVVHKDWRIHGLGKKLVEEIPTDGWWALELCHLAELEGLGKMAERIGFQACGKSWTWRHKQISDPSRVG